MLDYIIICGDLNLTLNQDIDNFNYSHVNNPLSREKMLNLMKNDHLMDIYRHLHPDTKKYMWFQRKLNKKARLDYFIISNPLADLIDSCNIKPGYRSDHSSLEMNLILNKFERGKGTFKLNCKLLKNKEYTTLINRAIHEEKLKYAVPVYNIDQISNVSDTHFTTVLDDGLFLEMLLQRIRGETIKFASNLKKRDSKREQLLISEIESLENNNYTNLDLLYDKKRELEKLRRIKMDGHIVRSRIQWLAEGEKPTSYFCSLERKNYIDKTVQKIKKKMSKL